MFCSLDSIYFSAYHDQDYMLESAHGICYVYPAPNIAPKNVAVVRVNGTHMNVTWGKLSLEEARGFITGYSVTYDINDGRKKREVRSEFVGKDESYKLIGSLDIVKNYYVTVSTRTSAGGVASDAVVVNGEEKQSHILLCSYKLCMILYSNKNSSKQAHQQLHSSTTKCLNKCI